MLNRSGNTTDNLCFRYRFRDVFSRFRCCVYNGTGSLLRKHNGNMEFMFPPRFRLRILAISSCASEDGRRSALLSKVLAIDFFMANRVGKVESEVFVGMGRFTVNTCL